MTCFNNMTVWPCSNCGAHLRFNRIRQVIIAIPLTASAFMFVQFIFGALGNAWKPPILISYAVGSMLLLLIPSVETEPSNAKSIASIDEP